MKMDRRLAMFKTDVNSGRKLMSYEWLETLVDKWIQEDEIVPNPFHEEMMDNILDSLIGRFTWKKALWTCSAFLNRINCPEDHPMFTRVNKKIADLVNSSSIKFLPQDIAELEVIRNHLSLHLKNPTLDETRCTLENAYNTLKLSSEKNQHNSSHPSWNNLVAHITSKTSFEHIYPPRVSIRRQKSLFWVDGKRVKISPPPPCSCHAAGVPIKQGHPDDNVIQINSFSEIAEAFKMFVEHFLLHIESPEMTPRLMRSVILIIIDLVDVALSHGIDSIDSMLKNMGEPTEHKRGIFMLWVWAGAMSNPIHVLTSSDVPNIRRVKNQVLHLLPHDKEEREEGLAVIGRIERNVVENIEREDFHSFLATFAKYYPHLGRRKEKEPPINELEYVYLNIRLEFGALTQCFSHSYFAKRVCATFRRYCSRGYDYFSNYAKIKEVDGCEICDSSSEEEDE